MTNKKSDFSSQNHGKNGKIKAFIFDLDDTLIETHPVFVNAIERVVDRITREHSLNKEEFKTDFDNAELKAHEKVCVVPEKLWPTLFDFLSEKYKFHQSSINSYVKDMMLLYLDPPNLFDDTIEILEKLKSNGYKLSILTHASQEWTDLKISNSGIAKYFESITCVDIARKKNSEDWRKAVELTNLDIESCAVVGDSINSDLLPAKEIGVRKIFWINRNRGWIVNTSGSIPQDVITIYNLIEIMSHL